MEASIFLREEDSENVDVVKDSNFFSNNPQSFLLSLNGISAFMIIKHFHELKTYIKMSVSDISIYEFDETLNKPFRNSPISRHLAISRDVRSLPIVVSTKANSFSSVRFNHLESFDDTIYLKKVASNWPSSLQALDILSTILSKAPHTTRDSLSIAMLLIDPSASDSTSIHQDVRVVVDIFDITHDLNFRSKWLHKIQQIVNVPLDPNLVHMPADYFNLYSVFLNISNCIIDINPVDCPSRMILILDKIVISTSIVPASLVVSTKIELRDVEFYLLNDPQCIYKSNFQTFNSNWTFQLNLNKSIRSSEISSILTNYFQPSNLIAKSNSVSEIIDPIRLHHLKLSTIYEYFDRTGFVKIASFDWCDLFVTTTSEDSPKLKLEVKNGILILFFCSDSLQTFLDFTTYISCLFSVENSSSNIINSNDIFYDSVETGIADATNEGITLIIYYYYLEIMTAISSNIVDGPINGTF